MTNMPPSEPCMLGVYAHPDDEVFSWGGTIALMADRGVRVVLAVATGGEEGSIVNPKLRGSIDLADLPDIRRREQACAQQTLGIAEVIRLGYRDSGMAGSDTAANANAFINVAEEDIVGRIVEVIRQQRPQVIVTFDEQGGYGHPDHIAVQRAARRAFSLAGDPNAYPDRGEPWTPLKLYYQVLAQRLVREVRDAYAARGLQFSFGSGLDEVDEPAERPVVPGLPDEVITTIVDISSTIDRKIQAFHCYATQMRPDFFYFTAPSDIVHGPLAHEYAVLVESRIDIGLPEHDPFDGIYSTG